MTGFGAGPSVLQTAVLKQLIETDLWVWQLLLLAGLAVSGYVLVRLARPKGRWARRLRSRLLLGVPWGTLVSIAFVLGVYLFVQGGIVDLHRPVTYAFQATGFSYPLGILTASFAHTSFNHLFGNLVGTLLFGSVAEYGVSHFTTRRGETSFSSVWTNPFARIGLFVLGVLVAGIVFSMFSWGPVIGFSGVVFAMAGLALILRPLTTVFVLLIDQSGLVNIFYNAIMNPVSSVQPTPSAGGVWFANIAVQGHLYGFLLGVLTGVVLLQYRRERPSATRIWAGAVLFGTAKGLWVGYWPLGNNSWALFRGLGLAFVFVLGALIAMTVFSTDRQILPAWGGRLRSLGERLPNGRRTALSIILIGIVFMSLVGGFINMAAVEGADLPNDPVQIRDYQITYTENTTNQQYAIVGIPGLNDVSTVSASGVIVANPDRNVWVVKTSTQRLRFQGYSRVLIGGVGWREEVLVTRTGWSVVGGPSTYRVRLHTEDGVRRTAYTSGPATSEVVIANRTLSMRTVQSGFEVVVTRNNETLGSASLPSDGENATVGGIRFERTGKKLYANYEGTRVQVAKKKEPGFKRFEDR